MTSFDSYVIDEQEKQKRNERMMNIETWSPQELALYEMVHSIENLGAHPMLTDVVNKLSDARRLLTLYFIEVIGDAPDERTKEATDGK